MMKMRIGFLAAAVVVVGLGCGTAQKIPSRSRGPYDIDKYVKETPSQAIRAITSSFPSLKPLNPRETPSLHLCGHYGAEGGLAGEEFVLFPDHGFIYLEWSDISPMEILDQGTWRARGTHVELVSSEAISKKDHPKRTDVFLFASPTEEGAARLYWFTRGSRFYFSTYSFIRRQLKKEMYKEDDLRRSLLVGVKKKILSEPVWSEVAERLLFRNEHRITDRRKLGRLTRPIPKDIGWQEVKKTLQHQYIDPLSHREFLRDYYEKGGPRSR
jgi:hypothetical protein